MRKGRRGRVGSRNSAPPLISIQLDPPLWAALHDIATQQGRPVGDLVMEIAGDSLGVAIRVYIEEFHRAGEEPSC